MSDSDCPSCDGTGYVTSRTVGIEEAECLADECPIVIFEVDL